MEATGNPDEYGHPQNRQQEAQLGEIKDGERISTTKRYLIHTGLMLMIFVACAAFWGASRSTPLVFSLDATRTITQNSKTFTFVWTLLGTILAYSTGAIFNQLLKTSIQQNVSAYGLRIGFIEFSSRLYSRKWLHDHRPGRLLHSILTVVFAIAFGLLVSAYTGLLTPTRVYLRNTAFGSELDVSSAAFNNWYNITGYYDLVSCNTQKTYGHGDTSVTLPFCPQVKDPIPYISAGLAAIQAKYAEYNPTTSVLGLTFNGTTKGILPRGFNTLNYFDTFSKDALPPVVNYNYSTIQQGISASVSCKDVGLDSAIVWKNQGLDLFSQSNGASKVEVYLQNFTYPIYNDYNLVIGGKDIISTFDQGYGDKFETTRFDLASYGSYANQWNIPNISCVIKPYLTHVNVTYVNTTGLFTANVVDLPGTDLDMSRSVANVIGWLFRTFTIATGNLIVNSVIAPSFQRHGFANVTINWPKSTELLIQGMIEYHATRLRMVMEAEINATAVSPSGYVPLEATISSWRLGYNGAEGSVIILFPLMGFILLISAATIALGVRTGVTHVTGFDPTNTTHIIIASALGGQTGNLASLSGGNAIHADDKALNLKVNYRDQSFQEVQEFSHGYTELSNLQPVDDAAPPTSGLFVRKPFMRTTTG